MRKAANLFLVGPMGAGKSTIGRRLARLFNWSFVDSDKEIEQRTGVSISMIFELEGEAAFRSREKVAIAELTHGQNTVLATGGGAILDADNRNCLSERGFVIYLQTSVEEQLNRTRHDVNRPLLQTPDPYARLEALLMMRDPLYRQVADLVVTTDRRRVRQVLRCILQRLPPEWAGACGHLSPP
jgi:shikimate kinase